MWGVGHISRSYREILLYFVKRKEGKKKGKKSRKEMSNSKGFYTFSPNSLSPSLPFPIRTETKQWQNEYFKAVVIMFGMSVKNICLPVAGASLSVRSEAPGCLPRAWTEKHMHLSEPLSSGHLLGPTFLT